MIYVTVVLAIFGGSVGFSAKNARPATKQTARSLLVLQGIEGSAIDDKTFRCPDLPWSQLDDGRLLLDVDTTRDYETVAGRTAGGP